MPALTDEQLAAWKQLQWATALITSRFRRDLAAAGLSLEQFDVLVHLAWAPSGTLPLHELTASLPLEPSPRDDETTQTPQPPADRLLRDDELTALIVWAYDWVRVAASPDE